MEEDVEEDSRIRLGRSIPISSSRASNNSSRRSRFNHNSSNSKPRVSAVLVSLVAVADAEAMDEELTRMCRAEVSKDHIVQTGGRSMRAQGSSSRKGVNEHEKTERLGAREEEVRARGCEEAILEGLDMRDILFHLYGVFTALFYGKGCV